MPRKSTRKPQRVEPYQIMTRRRTSEQTETTARATSTPESAQQLQTSPTEDVESSIQETSSLSSVPSSPSSVPPGLKDIVEDPPKSKKRKAESLEHESVDSDAAELLLYFASSNASTANPSRSTSHAPPAQPTDVLTPPSSSQETMSSSADYCPESAIRSTQPAAGKPQKKAKKVADPDYNPRLTHEQWKSQRYFPLYNEKKRIFYGADGVTQYNPASQRPSQRNSPATGSPRRPARGGRGGRRGGGNTNNNGRGRPKGRGRGGRDDSPEPPRQQILEGDEEETIRQLKARQLELKKMFSTIGAQQVEILDTLAVRDLNRLSRKPKAHKSVDEYEEIVAVLDENTHEVQEQVKERYDYFVQEEQRRFEREKELIEMQFKQRVEQVKEEHLEGCNGDITLLKKAHARDEDEDRTESGSERDFLPFHHELPESNTNARGYLSRAVQDDKSLREYHESQDDHVRQEVMQEEIKPLLELITKAKRKRQAEIDREQTQNIDALARAATREKARLDREEADKIGGYLIPRPLAGHENHAYGLSALADVADFVAQQHPDQNYIFMPLSPGHHLPRNALNFDALPSHRLLAPAAPPHTSLGPLPPPPLPSQAAVPVPARRPAEAPPTHVRRLSKQTQPSIPPTQQQPEMSYTRSEPLPPPPFDPNLDPRLQHSSRTGPAMIPQSQPPTSAQPVLAPHIQPTPAAQMPPHTLQSPIQPVYPARMPGHFVHQHSPTQAMPPYHRPSLNLQTSSNGHHNYSHSRQNSVSTPATPHLISSGPGQPIAPAPPKQTPISVPPSPFRRPSDPPPPPIRYTPMRQGPGPGPSSGSSFTPVGSPTARFYQQQTTYPQPPRPPPPQTIQQYIFQPPQQPPTHQTAPTPASHGSAWVPRYSAPANPNASNPNISSITTVGAGMGHTGKIPVTFVNQTVASRKAAAMAKAKKSERLDLNNRVGRGSRSQSVSGSEKNVGGSGEGESEGSRPSSAGLERGKEKEMERKESLGGGAGGGLSFGGGLGPGSPAGGSGSGGPRMLLPKA